MSYYIGATGEYIWEELLENTTSNVIISNHINFDAGPLTDAIQETITDALGTAVGELIAPITEVPSATGVGVVALTALGLLSYYKLNRTAVQDVDSMVYSADYASILTPGMFDDRVRIRYDTNQFSNVFYNVDNVKKGEILTSRINLLPAGVNDVDIYTSTGRVGIGTTPETQLHIYKDGNAAANIIRLETAVGGSSSIEFKRGTDLDIYADFRLIGYNGLFKLQYENNELAYGDTGTDIISASKTQITINKHTTFIENVGIGTYPATQLHIYNATSPTINIQSIADGTPILEFMRGTSSDVNKDYRFISQSDIFKLQFQDATTYYMDNNNQLIWINDTDTIIYKQTEFKANVLIEGDTRTVGYVGIGTTAATPLHIYTAAANILRLQTAPVSGTNSIEFMRGNSTDPLTDYRLLTDTGGKFKIQYANNVLAYGATDTDLIDLSTTNTTIYKPTEFKGNVGIGTAPHATYKVDVNGTTQSTAFIGDGAGLTNLGADKISTGSLNLDRITLTTSKLYQNFNQINFAIIDDKIDLPAEYSINITAYDNPTLHSDIRYKGKMSVSYDDRRNIYKLVTSDTSKTDNVAVLKYKAGDRIHIRNIANTEEDFITTTSGATIYLKTVLYKRAFSLTFNKVTDGLSNFTQVFEWESRGFSGVPQVVDYRIQDGSTFPRYNFTKLMTFVVEAGYAYYLMRLWRDPTNGLYNEVALADDFDDYLRAFGAGQTFRLESGYNQAGIDYIPRTYTPPGLSVGSSQELGGVKPRRGMAIDASTGYLDAIPISSDLITNMNTSHFTNNTGTNKIDISSTYVAPSATKLATARNIAGTAFDGTENINITYGNLTSIPATWGESQIPSLPISKITNLQSTLDGKAPTSHSHAIGDITNLQTTLDGKAPTSHTHAIADITNLQTTLDGKAPTSHTHAIADITNLQTTLDGKAPTSHNHAISDITNLQTTLDGKAPTSHTHAIGDITNLQTTLDGKAPTSHTHAIANITNLQTTLDAKQATLTAGTGITITGTTISSSSAFTPTSANLISVFNPNDFVNNVGTSKIDLSPNTSNYVARINTELTTAIGTKQATINSTAGQLIIGNGNGATTTNAGLTWNGGNTLNTTNLAVSTYATITRELTSVLSGGVDMFELRNNATNNLRFNQTWIGANDMRWQLIQKSNNVDYPVINFRNGKISVGTFSNPAYQLELVGDINITGSYRVNGNLVVVDYFSLNNKPIILQPSTTNLQLVSGYTLSVPGNMAVGTTAIATNVLQVGAGGRLRISNGATDYTLLGTIDTDGATNTSIVLSGNTRSTNAGNIQYLATASGGSHIFYTASTTTRMTISSSGVNINDNLGVSGNVGIGVAPATYKLNVNGSLNATSLYLNGSVFTGGSKWTTGAVSTNIYYNLGNVGIGTSTTPINLLELTKSSYTGALLSLDVGVVNAGAGVMPQAIGKPLLRLGRSAYSSTAGDYYGIGFGWAPTALSNSCCEIGVKISSTLGNEIGDILFSTRPVSTDIPASERMRIWNNGAVGIQDVWNSTAATGGYAIANNLMNSAGSLTIGNVNQNYGGGSGGVGNISGFMMECLNNTEMSVHDYGQVIHSFMYYSGSTFTIGRNMGWGSANVSIPANLNVGSISTNSISSTGTSGPLIIDPNYSTNNYVRIYDRLEVEGSLYANGTIQSTGAFYFASGLWHKCNASNDRFHFSANSTTYIKSGTTLGRQITFRNGGDQDIGYFENYYFYCYGPINISDRRIKRDIEEINDDDALNKILLVQPTTYYYRDETRNRGNGKVYGFIAQQIKEVIPDAVHTTKEIIANIYKTCLIYNKREIYHSIPQDVAIDTEVRILDKEGGEKGKCYKIKEIHEDHFVIDEDIDGDDCFVFGYCVNDLHAIDKTYIYTLNVCATQELHRRMEAQKVIIQSQDERIISQEERIKELEEKVERLLNYISL